MNRLRPILRRPPTTSPLELEGLKTHTTFSSCAQVRCAIQIPPFWRHRGTRLLGHEGEKPLIGRQRANETPERYHGVVFGLLNGTARRKRCGCDIFIVFGTSQWGEDCSSSLLEAWHTWQGWNTGNESEQKRVGAFPEALGPIKCMRRERSSKSYWAPSRVGLIEWNMAQPPKKGQAERCDWHES